MTYREFKTKYLGRSLDWDKNYGAQCVDVYRFYCDSLGFQQSPPVVGAKDIWNNYLKENFDRIDNDPNDLNQIPQAGDVIIWGTEVGQYGHVGICDRAFSTLFYSLDQNWPVGTQVLTEVKHSYKGVLGWLRPKLAINQNMTDEEKRILDFLAQPIKDPKTGETRKPTEGDVRTGIGYITDNIEKTVADLKAEVARQARLIDQLTDSLKSEKEMRASCQSNLLSANTELDTLKIQTLEAVPTGRIIKELFNRLINLK